MYWTLIKAGVLRKKARSILTVLSVSIAFLLFGLLQAASPIFSGQMEALQADMVITMNRYNMLGKLPYSHVEFIKCAGSVLTTPAIAGQFCFVDSVTSSVPPNIQTVPTS